MTYWKFLRGGTIGPFSGYPWPVGEWVTSDARADCRSGVHACRMKDLPYWLADELWQVELSAPVRVSRHKVVASGGRLTRRVAEWNAATAAELAGACVLRTVEHAAAELLGSGSADAADSLLGAGEADRYDVAQRAGELASARGAWQAASLCGYVLDAIETVADDPVACVAYIAARAAQQRSSADYAAEREWQAAWLATRLGLNSR